MGFKRWLRVTQPDVRAHSTTRVPSGQRCGPYAPRGSNLAVTRADAVAASTVAHYRDELYRIVALLTEALASFDRDPHEYGPTLAIRGYRARLGDALEQYFAAAGSRSVEDIRPVIDRVARVDLRLSSLDEEVCAEVARFETAAEDLARYVRPGAPLVARRLYADEANELLLELGLYRHSWHRALQAKETDRLNTVESILRSILDAGPAGPSAPPLPMSRSLAGDHQDLAIEASSSTTSSSTPEPSPASSSDGTYASIMQPLAESHYGGTSTASSLQQHAGSHGMFGIGVSRDSGEHGTGGNRRRHRPRRHNADDPASSSLSLSPAPSTVGPSSGSPPLSTASSHPVVSPPSPGFRRFGNGGSPSRSNGFQQTSRRRSQLGNAPLSPEVRHVAVRNAALGSGSSNDADNGRQPRRRHEDRLRNDEHNGRSNGPAQTLDRRGEAAVFPGSRSNGVVLDGRMNGALEGGGDSLGARQGMMVLSRSRTLRDMAALACTAESSEGLRSPEARATAAAESMYTDASYTECAQLAAQGRSSYENCGPGAGSGAGQQSGQEYLAGAMHQGEDGVEKPMNELSPAKSFASILYATQNVRSEAMSDEGIVFQPFRVRGDGRCLFRSVARSREATRGNLGMSERAEREVADDLRARAVIQLKQHRELLARFYVIETDFARYAKRMSNPRTFGGEPELLLLAKILHQPIAVYILINGRYKQIQVYGRQYRGEPCRILYSDGVHYDALLVASSRGGRRR
jgi:OTU-like cysteine protease